MQDKDRKVKDKYLPMTFSTPASLRRMSRKLLQPQIDSHKKYSDNWKIRKVHIVI